MFQVSNCKLQNGGNSKLHLNEKLVAKDLGVADILELAVADLKHQLCRLNLVLLGNLAQKECACHGQEVVPTGIGALTLIWG